MRGWPSDSSVERFVDDLQTLDLSGFKIEEKGITAIKFQFYNGSRDRASGSSVKVNHGSNAVEGTNMHEAGFTKSLRCDQRRIDVDQWQR